MIYPLLSFREGESRMKKKEASVILAKCAQDKYYGIRIEKRDNDWVRTWAFKLKERRNSRKKEGFDKINTGSFLH